LKRNWKAKFQCNLGGGGKQGGGQKGLNRSKLGSKIVGNFLPPKKREKDSLRVECTILLGKKREGKRRGGGGSTTSGKKKEVGG